MTLSDIIPKPQKTENTKTVLRWAALFLGELRDGLTMVSRQQTLHTVKDAWNGNLMISLYFNAFSPARLTCKARF